MSINPLNPRDIGKINEEISTRKTLLGDHEEGGFWYHAVMDCEQLVKFYNMLGDHETRQGNSKEAERLYKTANDYKKRMMLNYERNMDFTEALELAKELSDERASIYEKLSKVKKFRDEDEPTNKLFERLRQYRECGTKKH